MKEQAFNWKNVKKGHSVLVLIRSNPIESHRPVEGIRIALGLAAGDHQVNVVLMRQASLLLSSETDDLVDSDLIPTYLVPLTEWVETFYIEKGAVDTVNTHEYHVTPVTEREVAELIAVSERFIIL